MQGIIQGRGIDSDLNETGRAQSRAFFDSYKHIPFDKAYTSTLKRTKQSIEDFTKMGVVTEEHEGLDEINWGIFEGQKATEEHRKFFQQITSNWRSGDLHYAPENGESPAALQIRQKTALDYILSREDEENVLICMHGRAMRSFLCLMLNHPLSHMDDYPHTNLCLYVLNYSRENGLSLLEKNNLQHLNAEIRSNFP